MASQPIISFSEPVYRQPKPRVSFAVIAGEGAQAVDTAVKALPAETQAATLDDLAWRDMTAHLIATAEKLLSPRMYAAFLRWGEGASNFSTRYTDEEADARCDANSHGVRCVVDAPAANIHDVMLKVYLASIEAGDFGAFSALSDAQWQQYLVDQTARGAGTEALWFSPLTSMIDELAAKAWRASGAAIAVAIEPAIGNQITAAFSYARGVNSAARGVSLSHDLPAGYETFMRGALLGWNERYDTYLEARRGRIQYEQDVYTPAAPAIDHPIQQRYDDLVSVEGDALQRLLLAVAPSASELAIKLDLIRQHAVYELTGFDAVTRQLSFDARRFGRHGAHVQTDEAILSSFDELRADMARSHAGQPPAQDDDGWLKWLDATEAPIVRNRATTIEGVLAKLRLAFSHLADVKWSHHAIVDPRHADFADGIDKADMYEQLLWSGIDDLARIGGIDLSAPVPAAKGDRVLGDHADWLRERNTLIGQLNEPDSDPNGDDEGLRKLEAYDSRILHTPAATKDDLLPQLVLLAQIAAEGHEVPEELAVKLVRQSRDLCGVGSLVGTGAAEALA